MPRNKRNRILSPIGPISGIAPRTMPTPKQPGVQTKTERSKLISTPRKRRAALSAAAPEIVALQSSPTEQSDLASSPYSVVGSIPSEATEPPCFPSAKDLVQVSELNHPLASPEDICEDQSGRHPLISLPRECGKDPNFAGIHSGQNAPMPSCQGEGPLYLGAQGTLFHSPGESNSDSNYDHKRNNPSPFHPGVQAPANFGNQPGEVSLEVSTGQLSRLGFPTGNEGSGLRTRVPSGSAQPRAGTGVSTHRDPTGLISSENELIVDHSEETPGLASQTCPQATPEITYQTGSLTHLLQPVHGMLREPPGDLASSPVFTPSGKNPSPRGVFLQMEDIPRETYQFEAEWPNPFPSATLNLDALGKYSPQMPLFHGVPSSGIASPGMASEVHSFGQAAPDSQPTPYRNLFPIISPSSGYSSIESCALTGQPCAPIGKRGLQDYEGSVGESEDQDVILLNSHAGVFSDFPTGHGTIHSAPAIRKCEWVDISDPGGEEDGEEAHQNLPRSWWKASAFSSPLEALNEPVDEEILRGNDTAYKHSEDLCKLLNAPSYQAIDSIPGVGQSWCRIKLPVVTFRGPWQDIPNPDEDAMSGKYYGQILYSWTPSKRPPIQPNLPGLTALCLPVSNGTAAMPERHQQVAKPLSIIERRMAKQRAGVRKSSRTKNPSLKM
ncbi:unnamed protein product [Tuber aestivum]|uniref:Uncharacterized protein n=1 Tax=Tuber aestivum TaxID=59557 RepID=A0A292PI39_9PEZI|nr:unnamed protein product [Tuber aestivum]